MKQRVQVSTLMAVFVALFSVNSVEAQWARGQDPEGPAEPSFEASKAVDVFKRATIDPNYDSGLHDGFTYRSKSGENGELTATIKGLPTDRFDLDESTDTQIDKLVRTVAKENNLVPSAIINDETFLRRATIDIAGRTPTVAEYKAYMAVSPEKRREWLIDRILSDNEHGRYVERWSAFFAEMFRVRAGAQGGSELHQFIRKNLAESVPYHHMCRKLITAAGNPRASAAVGFFMQDGADPFEMAGIVSQTFMGVRLKCAQCHDHPFDIWTQEDYYQFAAYFGHTKLVEQRQPIRKIRVIEAMRSVVLWPPKAEEGKKQQEMKANWVFETVDENGEALQDVIARRLSVQHNQAESARFDELLDDALEFEGKTTSRVSSVIEDYRKQSMKAAEAFRAAPKRELVADLIIHPRNRYFAWNLVNRLWSEMIGRGMVEPVDDFRLGNDPTHPELLDYLADEFVASNYDVKKMIKLIAMSKTYQRTGLDGVNRDDRDASEEFFASAPIRRMPAEALHDSIVTAGHLFNVKHPEGANIRTKSELVRVLKEEYKNEVAESAKPEVEGPKMAMADKKMMADNANMPAKKEMKATAKSEGVAESIAERQKIQKLLNPKSKSEDDLFAAALLDDTDDPLSKMRAMEVKAEDVKNMNISFRQLVDMRRAEAAKRRAAQADQMAKEAFKYEYKEVFSKYDDNPSYQSAYIMVSPAPGEHFLRQFGQVSRTTMGMERSRQPTTRQALMLMNGRMLNEAARVGKYEPIAKLVEGDRKPDWAIEHTYIELLSRKPSQYEMGLAQYLVRISGDQEEAIADLRWALLNSLEFRYIP